jgi:O-antigen/teichoic acid export membrane protein
MVHNVSRTPPPDRISLKQRVLNAGTWTLAGYAVGQAIRFGTNLLMTRLLVPEMFGVMAIANMVMTALALFSDLGLKQIIIQSRRGNDPLFLNTAWTTQIFRGFVLWLIALMVGFLVHLFDRIGVIPKNSAYADSRLPYVIVALSFTALIAGFQSTKLFEASRNLSLRQVTKNEITAPVVGLIVMSAWAFFDRSIWALVAGNICTSLVMMLISHAWLSGIKNRLAWDKSAFREIFHFGKWIFLSSIFGFFVNNGDRLLLGGLIDATLLGVYTIAFAIFSAVEQVLNRIINDISLSALSEVARAQPEKLKANYYRFHIVIGCFAYFCSGILMFSGQTLIGLLYDSRYQQAGWMLEVLSTALLITPFNLAIMCLLALGFADLFAQIIAIRMVSLFLFVPLGFHFFGLSGALWGFVASYFSILPATMYYKIRYHLFDPFKELLLLPAWFGGIVIAKAFNLAITH